MYSYTFIIPTVLWLVVRYLNISPTTTLVQLICLYGYSNITWIPVAILSISPLLGAPTASNIIRWIFITLGFAFSGSFIGKNLYMVLIPRESANVTVNKSAGISVLIGVLLVHTAFALSVKILFFAGIKVDSGSS
jgi:protein YIPF1/2